MINHFILDFKQQPTVSFWNLYLGIPQFSVPDNARQSVNFKKKKKFFLK